MDFGHFFYSKTMWLVFTGLFIEFLKFKQFVLVNFIYRVYLNDIYMLVTTKLSFLCKQFS